MLGYLVSVPQGGTPFQVFERIGSQLSAQKKGAKLGHQAGFQIRLLTISDIIRAMNDDYVLSEFLSFCLRSPNSPAERDQYLRLIDEGCQPRSGSPNTWRPRRTAFVRNYTAALGRAPSATITVFLNNLEGILYRRSGTPACPSNTRVLAPHLRSRLAEDCDRAAAPSRTRRVCSATRL